MSIDLAHTAGFSASPERYPPALSSGSCWSERRVRSCSFLSVLEASVFWRSWQVMPASSGKACSYLPSLGPFPSLPPPLRLLSVGQTSAFPCCSDVFAQASDGHACLVAQSCSTPCNPVDYSLPGFSVHGIFQGRILEWIAISSSRGSPWPRDQTYVSALQMDSIPLTHWESPPQS